MPIHVYNVKEQGNSKYEFVQDEYMSHYKVQNSQFIHWKVGGFSVFICYL